LSADNRQLIRFQLFINLNGNRSVLANESFKKIRVARWYIFIPKIPIWENLDGLGMENVGIF
jgi:hypothetical protein